MAPTPHEPLGLHLRVVLLASSLPVRSATATIPLLVLYFVMLYSAAFRVAGRTIGETI